MNESDKDKFAELDSGLQYSGEYSKRAIDKEKAYFAKHMPELEQLVRWWNIKMDEFNYGKQKLRIKEDYNKKKNGWVVYLFQPPTFGKGLVFKLSLEEKIRTLKPHMQGKVYVKHKKERLQKVITEVFKDKKQINIQKKHLFTDLDGLRVLMTSMIAQSSNYQDAIPDK